MNITIKYRWLSFLILFISLSCFSVFADNSAETLIEIKPNTGAIRGVVKGMIIKNGRVYYKRIPNVNVSIEFTAYKTKTGIDGRFTLVNIPAGEHQIRIDFTEKDYQLKPVFVEKGKMSNTESAVFFIGIEHELPPVKAGSLLGVFARPVEIQTGDRDQKSTPVQNGDTPTNSLIFYEPDTFKAYLEIVIDVVPIKGVFNKDGSRFFLGNTTGKVEIWNIEKLEPEGEFAIPGTITDLRWNKDGRILMVSYFNNHESGIVIFDSEFNRIIKTLKPPPIGIISSVISTDNEKEFRALLSRIKDGRLIALSPDSKGKYIVSMNRKVGDFPTDLVYLKRFNSIMVVNNRGNSVVTLDSNTFDIKFILTLEGKPGRITASSTEGKVYVTIVDQGAVAVLDGSSGRVISMIPIGEKPYHLQRKNDLLFVSNYSSRNISVIDTIKDRVIYTTPPENHYRINSVDIMP